MRMLVRSVLVLVLIFSAYIVYKVWNNNRDVPVPERAAIQQHFQRSVDWLASNYHSIKYDDNPVLWWMLKQAGENSDDDVLIGIFDRYRSDYLDKFPPNISTPMFDETYKPDIPHVSNFSGIAGYQTFIFYGISCDAGLAESQIIQQQLLPDYCALHFLHPRCVTHQLVGLRFMQRYDCGYDDLVESTIGQLQDKVVSELTWDFRVGDAYMQRVLMLVDSGAEDRVKPVWLSNILQSQNPDGSWDDIDPVITLWDGHSIAYTSKLPRVTRAKADFHTTAQGVWLLSMLLNK